MWVTLVTFLLGVVTGLGLVALGAWYILSFFLLDDPASQGPSKTMEPTSATFQLPPALTEKITDDSCKHQESCWALNFVLSFLFRELRNSEGVRRWVLRKLCLEFEELLATSVLGKFFSNISIQNVDLGQNFPILNWLKTTKVELHPVFRNISTLDILVDLEYAGGFQFSIQAETHLKHSAYLSVQFKGVKGQARLGFTTEPYAHWSFSFAENPEIDISVVSQLYGKSFSHITSMIASQLKRSVRKKHTLPMYKIRYKPFFSRIEPILAALVPNSAPRAEVKGELTVTLIECQGLMENLLTGNVYSSLALGDFDWVAIYVDNTNTVSIVRDLVYVKTGRRETNLDFTLAMSNDIPIVESLYSKSESTTKQHLEFQVGDEILAVDGKKVTSVKNCVKNFKYSTSMKVIWRIRRKQTLSLLTPVEEAPVNGTEEVAATITTINSQITTTTTTMTTSVSDPVQVQTAVTDSSANLTPITCSASNEPPASSTTTNKTDGANGSSKTEKLELPIHSLNGNGTNSQTKKSLSATSTPSPSRRSSVPYDLSSANNATTDSGFPSQQPATEGDGSPTRGDRDLLGRDRERSYSYASRNARQIINVVKTAELPSTKDPIFTESFSLKVEDSHRFLNLGVWSSQDVGEGGGTTTGSSGSTSSPTGSPSKRAKNSLANLESITFNNDRLIGSLSIPIADVITECSTTGMGYFVKDYYLRSPDGMAADAKDNPLTTHSGFEPHMCYGKISLSFLFKGDEEASKLRDSFESMSSPPIEIALDALSEPNNISLSPTEEFQSHNFVRTNFRSTAVCDYCNKKIWLKDAFACRICFMKCHKKCNDRCIANTICRGEGFYPSIPNLRAHMTPEIITTGDPDDFVHLNDDGNSDAGSISSYNLQPVQPPQASGSGSNGVRRRTLGGLIVSAVQNRSAQLNLRRAGSASNLLAPSPGPNTISKSLPPSPKASPTTSRKMGDGPDVNPFEVLNAGGFGSSEEDISAAVEHLIQNPNDDLVAMAKETGRDVYSDLSLVERKQKLNHVLNRIQEEIDLLSHKRMDLSRQEASLASGPQRAAVSKEILHSEERVQALALLMLYYCAGLQQVHELEKEEESFEVPEETPTDPPHCLVAK